MKVNRRDSTDEKRILTGLIVDTVFLGRVAQRWHNDLFTSRWSNLIAKWCVSHFNKYGKAPGSSIEGIFESWTATEKDKDTINLVERFLSTLSEEYDELAQESQTDYLTDIAADFFNRIKAQRLAEQIEGDIDVGKVQEAVEKIQAFHKVDMGVGAPVDVVNDQDALREAFERRSDVLVNYPGALGKFFGRTLERDGFVAFMGPEKRGKTFWLMDVAWRAMTQRRRVAFFAVGDMSQDQMMRRFATRAAKRPLYPDTIKFPAELAHDGKDKDGNKVVIINRSETRTYKKPLTWRMAHKKFQEVAKKRTKSHDPYLRMSVHPNSSINVEGIRGVLTEWEREGWTPDVVVIDYADILAPPAGRYDNVRDQTNTLWKQMRGLSQELHCLVVTATQSDASSYDAKLIRKQNFSEDKRKLAHVTGLVGLNAESTERSKGVMRLNWVVLRENKFSESHCVYVAGCLEIANPALRSIF